MVDGEDTFLCKTDKNKNKILRDIGYSAEFLLFTLCKVDKVAYLVIK